MSLKETIERQYEETVSKQKAMSEKPLPTDLTALGSSVIILQDPPEAEFTSDGGIIKAATYTHLNSKATVVAVGEEVIGLQRGDRVMLREDGYVTAGSKFTYKGFELAVVDRGDCLVRFPRK